MAPERNLKENTNLHGNQSIIHHNFLCQTMQMIEVNERMGLTQPETYKSAPMVALY